MHSLKHHTLSLAALAGSLLLASCSAPDPVEQKADMNEQLNKIEDKMADSKMAPTAAAWENERTAILSDLRDLRDNIDKKLSQTNEKLADAKLKPSVRTEHETLRTELEREKNRVEELIIKAEKATDATWSTTKADIERTSTEVKGWWARLKDNVDKKTTADKDNDGH